MPLGLECT